MTLIRMWYSIGVVVLENEVSLDCSGVFGFGSEHGQCIRILLYVSGKFDNLMITDLILDS